VIDRFRRAAQEYRLALRVLGRSQILQYTYLRFLRTRLSFIGNSSPVALTVPELRHPILLRPGTSDVLSIKDIFLDQEYACLPDSDQPGLILDCGANVGYASAWFLSHFPQAKVVAIEPDAENYALLEQNLRPYGGRATTIRSGVWSHSCDLTMEEQPYRDGREWSRQVRECRPGEPGLVRAVDIQSVLASSGFDRIRVLKMDVERAEAVIFASGYEAWLPKVDNILIELHDEECDRIFHTAVAGENFTISHSGELTVCRRHQ
jgi:FkbM family methyltransferase